MIRIIDIIRQKRDRRRQQRHGIEDAASNVEKLEQRQLLTMAVNFDFSAFASGLSPDQRLFGSTDPADAPLQVIHYGQGTITSIVDFNPGGLLDNPGDLTFEFGSQDPTSTATQLNLIEFDDGVVDGVANQIYRDSASDNLRFYYQGTLFSTWDLSDLELQGTPDGQINGSALFSDPNVSEIPEEDLQPDLVELIWFSLSQQQTGSPGTLLTLSTVASTGAWNGAADGEVYGGVGVIESSDDASDTQRFATDWDFSSPYVGIFEIPGDRDWVRTMLTPNVEHTFEAPENTGFVDYRVLDANGETIHGFIGPEATIFPPRSFVSTTPVVYFEFVAQHTEGRGDFEVSLASSAAAPWELSGAGSEMISWTRPTDEAGNEYPVDAYRVRITSNGDLAYTEDLDASTLTFDFADLGGLSLNTLTVERIVNGTVEQTAEPWLFSPYQVRGNFTTSGSGVFEWDPIPGARTYQLFLNDPTNVVGTFETQYTLPADYPLGWHRAWVRGVGDRTFRGLWSQPVNYHARSAVQTPTVNHETIGRPEINWTSLGGAETYELSIQNVSTGVHNIVHETELTGNTYSVTEALPVGTYRVWMRGVTGAGIPGAWSASDRFTVGPAPVSVVAGASTTRPVFTWSVPAGIASVDLFISNAGNVTTMSDVTGTSWTATSDFVRGNITWWVRGVDAGGNRTAWSNADSARIGNTWVDGSDTLLEADGAPRLTWLPVLGAESYEVLFRSYTDGDIRTITGLTDTSYQPDAFGPGRYSVWVNTVNSVEGNAWSNRFQFDVAGHDVRILVGPSGTVTTNTPTVAWVPELPSSATRLWVRDETANTNVQIFVQSGNSYTFQEPLTAGRYRVWAIDHSNPSFAGWSRPIVFTVAQTDDEVQVSEPESLMAALQLSPLEAGNEVGSEQLPPEAVIENAVDVERKPLFANRRRDLDAATGDVQQEVFGEVNRLLNELQDVDQLLPKRSV